jgi:hypothetical protein
MACQATNGLASRLEAVRCRALGIQLSVPRGTLEVFWFSPLPSPRPCCGIYGFEARPERMQLRTKLGTRSSQDSGVEGAQALIGSEFRVSRVCSRRRSRLKVRGDGLCAVAELSRDDVPRGTEGYRLSPSSSRTNSAGSMIGVILTQNHPQNSPEMPFKPARVFHRWPVFIPAPGRNGQTRTTPSKT